MPSGLRFFFAILIGAFFAGVFGLLIGIPVLRLKGDYMCHRHQARHESC